MLYPFRCLEIAALLDAAQTRSKLDGLKKSRPGYTIVYARKQEVVESNDIA